MEGKTGLRKSGRKSDISSSGQSDEDVGRQCDGRIVLVDGNHRWAAARFQMKGHSSPRSFEEIGPSRSFRLWWVRLRSDWRWTGSETC
jgi:hypothetical protein